MELESQEPRRVYHVHKTDTDILSLYPAAIFIAILDGKSLDK
jgi:hypothetical protein